jgi:hypothetical protein
VKQFLGEASVALAHLDAERLEEMALSCEALTQEEAGSSGPEELETDIAILDRVIEATRANLTVMRQLSETRGSRLEYGAGVLRGARENEVGNH